MKEEFFEGKDFEKEEFKALIPKYYPKKYKDYSLSKKTITDFSL